MKNINVKNYMVRYLMGYVMGLGVAVATTRALKGRYLSHEKVVAVRVASVATSLGLGFCIRKALDSKGLLIVKK